MSSEKDNDMDIFNHIKSIIKEKEKSPYSLLKKFYEYLCIFLWLLGFASIIAVIYAISLDYTWMEIMFMWLSIALLFGVPILAHEFSIIWIYSRTPRFPILGHVPSVEAWWKKGPYLACVRFAGSGVAYWVVATIPQLRSAIESLPLGRLSFPIILVVAIILPFIIWLFMSLLAWKSRRDPFGP